MDGEEYSVLLYSPGFQFLQALDHVASCTYSRGQNDAGEIELTVPDGYYNPALFVPFNIVLIQRTIPGLAPYIDLQTPWFLLDGPTYSLDAGGVQLVTFRGTDAVGLILASRNVAYNDYNSYTYKLAAADNMLKAVVRENAGSLATDTSRNLTNSGFTVAADVAAGPIIRMGSFARQPMLQVLQDIATASANNATTPTWLGFDVTLANMLTGALEFTTYTGQRGVDHRQTVGTPPVILSPEAGNLADVEVGNLYRNSVSFMYVAGAGVADIRAIATASSAALIALSPYGRREGFTDGSQIVDPAALTTLAAGKLYEQRPRKYFTGRIVQTNNTLRGVHWDYGDYLTATYRNQTYDVRVDKIAVKLSAAENGGLLEDVTAYLRSDT